MNVCCHEHAKTKWLRDPSNSVQGLDVKIDCPSHTPVGENESNASIHNATAHVFRVNDSLKLYDAVGR